MSKVCHFLLLALVFATTSSFGQGVVINELFYAPSAGDSLEFVELHNASNRSVDLSGWSLDRGIQFTFPDGTSIAAGSFVVVANDRVAFSGVYNVPVGRLFGDYGRSLSNSGEIVRLRDSFGATRDEVRYSSQFPWPLLASQGSHSLQRRCMRMYTGSFTNWISASPTPIAPNLGRQCPPPAYPVPRVVIHEVFYNSLSFPDSTVEFVELRNTTNNTINVSGWSFTDGIDFVIPDGTSISPNGYLVVASDAANSQSTLGGSNVVGDFVGDLADGGERIEISDASLNPVDAIKYSDGGSWTVSADGFGFSLEKISPRADGWDPAAWRSAVSGSSESSFVEIEVSGPATSSDLHFFLEDEGEVLLDDISVTANANPGVDLFTVGGFSSGITGWSREGTHDNSRSQLVGGIGDSTCCRVISNGAGDMSGNSVSYSIDGGLNGGSTYTVRARAKILSGQARLVVALGGSSPGSGLYEATAFGEMHSPGRANTSAKSAAPPFVVDARVSPRQPTSTDRPVVTALVSTLANVGSVELTYDAGDGPVTVAMLDNGATVDELPGDRQFSVELPELDHGSLVRYSIEATDASGTSRVFPMGNDATGDYAFVVDDDAGAVAPIRVYDIRGLSLDLNELDCDLYSSGHFVHDGDVFLNIGVRNRGSCSPQQIKRHLRARFNRRKLFNGIRRMLFNSLWSDKSLLREELAWDVIRRQNLPYAKARHIRVLQDGELHGLFLQVENPEGKYLERNGLDRDGNLYLSEGGAEQALPNAADYAGEYSKRTNRDGDFSDLASFLGALDSTSSSSLVSWFHSNVAIESEIDYQTAIVGSASTDHIDENHLLYHDPLTGLWTRSLWDVDLSFGRFDDPALGVYNDSIDVEQVGLFFGVGQNALTTRFFEAERAVGRPYFRRAYLARVWAHLREKINEIRTTEAIEDLRTKLRDDALADYDLWGRFDPSPDASHPDDFCYNVDELLDVRDAEGTGFLARRLVFLRSELDDAGFDGFPWVRISEIMYHPLGVDTLEFVELKNTESSPVDVSGWFVDPAGYEFPNGTVLAPGEIVLVVRDPVLFDAEYPGVTARRFGPYPGKLFNGGGHVRLYDNAPGTLLPIPSFPTEYPIAIDSVVYGDSRVSDWPMAADGEGYSLELEHLSLDNDRPGSWRASAQLGGSPGVIVEIRQKPKIVLEISTIGGTAPLEVQFDASASFDPDDDGLSFDWIFGDGGSASGSVVSHTFEEPGVFDGLLTVDDGAAGASVREFRIKVTEAGNRPPVLSFEITPTTGTAPLEVTFDASASSDPDDDAIVITWTFGDGDSMSGAQVSHTYTDPGVYDGTVSVDDSNHPPVEQAFQIRVDEDGQIVFKRGDSNGDSAVDLSDAVWTLRWSFAGGMAPSCLKAADTNGDGSNDVSDAIYMLNYLFRGGPRIAAPGPVCGTEDTPTAPTCEIPNCD